MYTVLYFFCNLYLWCVVGTDPVKPYIPYALQRKAKGCVYSEHILGFGGVESRVQHNVTSSNEERAPPEHRRAPPAPQWDWIAG